MNRPEKVLPFKIKLTNLLIPLKAQKRLGLEVGQIHPVVEETRGGYRIYSGGIGELVEIFFNECERIVESD